MSETKRSTPAPTPKRHHPFPLWAPMRLIRRVDRRRRDTTGFRPLGRYGSLLIAGRDGKGRLLATYLIHEKEADLRFDRRRSWRYLVRNDPGQAGGDLLIMSATLAGPDKDDLRSMREELERRGWRLMVGTDATPEAIRAAKGDPRVRGLWRRVRATGRRIEVHPASESPFSESTRLHHHAWTEREWVHIGLVSDLQPEDLAHELMHVLLAEEGYPNALRFIGSEDEDHMIAMCGLLDLEVDRRLLELGFTFPGELERANQLTEMESLPKHWSSLETVCILLGRFRRLPASERDQFGAWATRLAPRQFRVARRLDSLLPAALSPLDVAVGVLLAAHELDVSLGFMPAPLVVDGPQAVPAWQLSLLQHAHHLDVAEPVTSVIDTWAGRECVPDDYAEGA